MLLRLGSEALKVSGWPTEVLTGRFMFHSDYQDENSGKLPEFGTSFPTKYQKPIE
jgi:hypothetical protein